MNLRRLSMVALLICVLTTHSWARSTPRVQPFQQYIDHQSFTKLSTEEQKAYLIAIMETLAQMEQEVLDGDGIYTNDHAKRDLAKRKKTALYKVRAIFEQLSDQVSVPRAHAQTNMYCPAQTLKALEGKQKLNASGEVLTCMYGTYMSNMVKGPSHDYCVRPACSSVPEFANAHNSAAKEAGCKPAQMVCNPSIYGKQSNSQKASCVTLDFVTPTGSFANIAQNASLACLMEVTNDPESEKRLEKIANSIVNPEDGQKENVANNFNRMLSIITNVCLCGDTGFNNRSLNSYEANFDPGYVTYLNGHRSCNALLSQMQLLTGKISENKNYCTDNSFLPNNLTQFSSTLSDLALYSSRVNRNMSGSKNWDASKAQDRNKAMRELRERWIVTDKTGLNRDAQVVSADKALDNIFDTTKLESWKNSLCPLRLESPSPAPTALECKLAATTGALVLNANNFEFTLPGHSTKPESLKGELIWTHDGKPFTGSGLPATEGVSEVTLSAKLKLPGETLECGSITFTKEKQAEPEEKALGISSCTIAITSPSEAKEIPQDGSAHEVSARLTQLNSKGTSEIDEDSESIIVWKLNGQVVSGQTKEAFTHSTTEKEVTLSAEVGGVICEATVIGAEESEKEESEKEPESCIITLTMAPSAGPGLYNIEASVAPVPSEGESVTFSGMSELKAVKGSPDVVRGDVAGIAQAQKKKLTATYKVGEKSLSCESEVEIPAAQGAAPTGNQQQPFMPPSEPGFMFQKRGVN